MPPVNGIIAKIKQRTDGMTELLNASDVPIAILSVWTEVRRNAANDGFIFRDNLSGAQAQVFTSKLISYQIEPAAAVPFTGSMWDWWCMLVEDFFPTRYPYATSSEIVNCSNVSGQSVTDALNNLIAGGGVVEDNIISKAVNYTLLDTDYIIYATAGITITLPTISGVQIGQVYRIFANNNKVTVECDTGAGDTITDKTSIKLKIWDSATFRAIYPNQWLIAD